MIKIFNSTVSCFVVSSRTYVKDIVIYQHFIRSFPSVEFTSNRHQYQYLMRTRDSRDMQKCLSEKLKL